MSDSTELANAPTPDAMREELINILMNHGGGNISRTKAGGVVDLMLAKQMAFYSQMADAEVDMSGQEAALAVAELPGRVDTLIRLGAKVGDAMLPDDRRNWQRSAEMVRESVRKLVDQL